MFGFGRPITRNEFGFADKHCRNWAKRSNADFSNRMKQRSMLHQETLAMLDMHERQSTGSLKSAPTLAVPPSMTTNVTARM
jgi:hypothetical protein